MLFDLSSLVLVDRLTKIFTRLFDRVAGVLRSVLDLISEGLLRCGHPASTPITPRTPSP